MSPRQRVTAWLVVAALLSVPAHAASSQSGGGAPGGDVFTGFNAKSKDPIQVDAKALEVFEENKQRISVFTGDVVVTRGPTVMHASKMKLYSDLAAKDAKGAGGKAAASGPGASGPGGGSFTRIEAFGPVTVTSEDQSATGANAVVDMKTHILTLTGNVVLTRGKDVATGDRLVVDLQTGRAKIDQAPGKPIRVIISPETASAAGQQGGDTKGKGAPTQ
jgi:lipopolysaccharide export system protein LptA